MIDFITEHKELLAALLAVIAAIIGVIWGVNRMKKQKSQKRTNNIKTVIKTDNSISNFSNVNFGVQNQEVNIEDEHSRMD